MNTNSRYSSVEYPRFTTPDYDHGKFDVDRLVITPSYQNYGEEKYSATAYEEQRPTRYDWGEGIVIGIWCQSCMDVTMLLA